MTAVDRFDALLGEGEAVDVAGWDFSWFVGRASEQRPPWGYQRLMVERVEAVRAALDVQTGGGEVLSAVRHAPPVLCATDSWPPNLALARERLAPLGARVLAAEDAGPLPFAGAAFDLVVSRHPTTTPWNEIARVLRPGGAYLSQQVGMASMHELSAAMLGPFEPSTSRSPDVVAAEARDAGMQVVDLRASRSRVEFHDIAAVVVFLRKVIWTVPDFTTQRFRDQLFALHRAIERDGAFVAHSTRFLIEARR